MADDSSTTIWATFDTREAAELAVEHLVQLRGILRPDIFIQSATTENTAGSASSGSDASHDGEARTDAALEGEIVVAADQIAFVQRNHGDAGAIRVLGR